MKRVDLLRRAYWSVYAGYHYLGQARYPFRSAERIARDRDRRVRHMVAYAYRWVPYYRETLDRLGLAPTDFRCFADLGRLPLISVADLQADPARFRSQQFSLDELLPLSSSGSTGRPHTVWHDLATLYQNIGHAKREHAIFQQVLGKRRLHRLSIASVLGSATSVRLTTRANALWPRRLAPVAQPLDADASPASWVQGLATRRPELLSTYGNILDQLVAYCRLTGTEPTWPAIARYSAAGLPEPSRHWLEGRGVQVFSGYQAVEAFKMGFECAEHNGYHLNDDLYPLRIVDEQGRDCAPGEVGEIVLSNLVNRGTVLLNYRMGDLAARLAEPCPCGRNLPRLSYITGRTVDDLYDTSGGHVPYGILTGLVRQVRGILQYQATQYALDRLRIDLVVTSDCDRVREEAALIDRLRQRFGRTLQVEVRFVDEIERTPAGKVRYVRNLVAKEQA